MHNKHTCAQLHTNFWQVLDRVGYYYVLARYKKCSNAACCKDGAAGHYFSSLEDGVLAQLPDTIRLALPFVYRKHCTVSLDVQLLHYSVSSVGSGRMSGAEVQASVNEQHAYHDIHLHDLYTAKADQAYRGMNKENIKLPIWRDGDLPEVPGVLAEMTIKTLGDRKGVSDHYTTTLAPEKVIKVDHTFAVRLWYSALSDAPPPTFLLPLPQHTYTPPQHVRHGIRLQLVLCLHYPCRCPVQLAILAARRKHFRPASAPWMKGDV